MEALRDRHVNTIASLMDEAATALAELMYTERAEELAVRHFLPDELNGSAMMLREAYGLPAAPAVSEASRLTQVNEPERCTVADAMRQQELEDTRRTFKVAMENARNAIRAVKISIEEGDTDEALRLIDEALGGS